MSGQAVKLVVKLLFTAFDLICLQAYHLYLVVFHIDNRE